MIDNYNHDSVQELLSWAKNMLQNKTYPEITFQLNTSSRILDCSQFLDTMIATIENNWENPTFRPIIKQLWTFKELIEGKAEIIH